MEKELDSRVYVVSCAAGPVKIGATCDLDRRIKEIQTYSPFVITYEKSFRCTWSDAMAIEATAHRYLGKYRLQGEWFDVESLVAVNAVIAAFESVIHGKNSKFTPTKKVPLDREECLRRAREGARFSRNKPGRKPKLTPEKRKAAKEAWSCKTGSNQDIATDFGVSVVYLHKAFGARSVAQGRVKK